MFTFGSHTDIYNPWSITNYLAKKQLYPYWAATSSNRLINQLLQKASGEMKTMMETLLDGKTITVNIDEQIVFEQLGQNENAVWSLLLAGGISESRALHDVVCSGKSRRYFSYGIGMECGWSYCNHF